MKTTANKLDELIFIPNLLNPKKIKQLKLPLEFIAFGYVEGKLYKKEKTAVLTKAKKSVRGNSVVYGAVFLCKRFDYYDRVLDGLFGCSMSALKKNHTKDFMHRVEESVTIIKFSTIRDLVYLNYKEVMVVNVQTWFANPMHKSYSTLTEKHNRIVDGILAEDFYKLYKEVG